MSSLSYMRRDWRWLWLRKKEVTRVHGDAAQQVAVEREVAAWNRHAAQTIGDREALRQEHEEPDA